MKEIIYNKRGEAIAACLAYVDAVKELQEKLGVIETSDDDCVRTYVYAKYRDEAGNILTFEY